MQTSQAQSPNHDSRGDAPIDMLLLHYTGMKSAAEALERLCDSAAKVSAHYLVEEDGSVFQLVPEEQRAWHAGVASWAGQNNINARSIGIEIVNPGHEWGYRDFPPVQMQAVCTLCRDILSRHTIKPRNIIGHSDVAPARKQDPGERFNWAWLAEQGIGLYFPAEVCRSLGEQTNGPAALRSPWQATHSKLITYGYSASDASAEQLITAFQRHFRPERVNGVWDAQCEARLDWLLENT